MTILSKEQILMLHSQLIKATGAFPSLQQKAARLGYGLIKNHPFIDGNKRIGAHVMLVFLALNKIELKYTQDELSNIILKIAAEEYSFHDLLEWIFVHQL